MVSILYHRCRRAFAGPRSEHCGSQVRARSQIDRLLDVAEASFEARDWEQVQRAASDALSLDPDHVDASSFASAAERNLGGAATAADAAPEQPAASRPAAPAEAATEQPASFGGGRYEVRRFLGEGGKKRVFLAHDTQLDRNVAFSLIKTDGLDDTGRERITREAQSMGRLGSSPHIVTIYEIGTEAGQPYLVQELMSGGDVEGLLEGGPLPLPPTLEIAKNVARGLAFAHDQGVVHRDLKPGSRRRAWTTQAASR